MREQRFGVTRRGLVAANAGVAAFGIVFGVVSAAADRPWGSVVALLLLAVAHATMAWQFARQHVALTGEAIVATQGLRRHRVAWRDVERVHLDWAAEAAGHDREVLRIEQPSGATVRSGAAAGMGGAIGGPEATRLASALRRRAAHHGFEVEVHDPSWRTRGSNARRS